MGALGSGTALDGGAQVVLLTPCAFAHTAHGSLALLPQRLKSKQGGPTGHLLEVVIILSLPFVSKREGCVWKVKSG